MGSNPTEGMDVSLLLVLCVVRQRSLRQADHLSRGVLPTVVHRRVYSRNLKNEEAMACSTTGRRKNEKIKKEKKGGGKKKKKRKKEKNDM